MEVKEDLCLPLCFVAQEREQGNRPMIHPRLGPRRIFRCAWVTIVAQRECERYRSQEIPSILWLTKCVATVTIRMPGDMNAVGILSQLLNENNGMTSSAQTRCLFG